PPMKGSPVAKLKTSLNAGLTRVPAMSAVMKTSGLPPVASPSQFVDLPPGNAGFLELQRLGVKPKEVRFRTPWKSGPIVMKVANPSEPMREKEPKPQKPPKLPKIKMPKPNLG